MYNAEQINDILAPIGKSAESKICFKPVLELLEDGVITLGELKAPKNLIDWFDLVNVVTVRIIMEHIENGVEFLSLDGIVISPDAKIGRGSVIHPGTQIRQGAVVGENCVIGPVSVIENSTVGNDCTVNAAQIYNSVLENNVKIGPFCHIRPNSHICSGVKIGDFVEVKNSTLGKDSHASHLTYIGDSDVGERVNFGCGTVTCNYDGYNKNRCVIGDDAFVGCNTNLIAPVTLGNGAYTAAGSTITDSIPAGGLGIARSRQSNKDGWADDFKAKNQKD